MNIEPDTDVHAYAELDLELFSEFDLDIVEIGDLSEECPDREWVVGFESLLNGED